MIAVHKGVAKQMPRVPTGWVADKIIIDASDVNHMVRLMEAGQLEPWLRQLQYRFVENRTARED